MEEEEQNGAVAPPHPHHHLRLTRIHHAAIQQCCVRLFAALSSLVATAQSLPCGFRSLVPVVSVVGVSCCIAQRYVPVVVTPLIGQGPVPLVKLTNTSAGKGVRSAARHAHEAVGVIEGVVVLGPFMLRGWGRLGELGSLGGFVVGLLHPHLQLLDLVLQSSQSGTVGQSPRKSYT